MRVSEKLHCRILTGLTRFKQVCRHLSTDDSLCNRSYSTVFNQEQSSHCRMLCTVITSSSECIRSTQLASIPRCSTRLCVYPLKSGSLPLTFLFGYRFSSNFPHSCIRARRTKRETTVSVPTSKSYVSLANARQTLFCSSILV